MQEALKSPNRPSGKMKWFMLGAAVVLMCVASTMICAWGLFGRTQPSPLIVRSKRAVDRRPDGTIEQVYWYYEKDGRRTRHGPLLSFHKNGQTLSEIVGFVHDSPAAGMFEFYRPSQESVWTASLRASSGEIYSFIYSLDGKEVGQLYWWNGHEYEGTTLLLTIRGSRGITRSWIEVYADGKLVHEQNCEVDDQFHPVSKGRLPSYYQSVPLPTEEVDLSDRPQP
jgi:hypothetical protein